MVKKWMKEYIKKWMKEYTKDDLNMRKTSRKYSTYASQRFPPNFGNKTKAPLMKPSPLAY